MSDIVVLVVEDEAEVRTALVRDLGAFEAHFRIEATADAEEAAEVVADVVASGGRIGLVLCDHLLPGRRGTDFLIGLNRDPSTAAAKKVLITGQAGHQDTIRAINEADLDHYIAKPWTREDLHDVVRRQLTDYVLETGENPLPFVATLDAPRLLEAARHTTWDR